MILWDTAPWASATYNGAYMLPNTVFAIILCPLIGVALARLPEAKNTGLSK
jgi:hypothetical protein